MPDIMEIAKIQKIDFLVTMGIEKAFDSLDHSFLISSWEIWLQWELHLLRKDFIKRSRVISS